jgi:hypothetical protein
MNLTFIFIASAKQTDIVILFSSSSGPTEVAMFAVDDDVSETSPHFGVTMGFGIQSCLDIPIHNLFPYYHVTKISTPN